MNYLTNNFQVRMEVTTGTMNRETKLMKIMTQMKTKKRTRKPRRSKGPGLITTMITSLEHTTVTVMVSNGFSASISHKQCD